MLNFEDLKNAKSGNVILIDAHGTERYFAGIVKDRLVTIIVDDDSACVWEEHEIESWSIKKETKKLYQYAYKDGRRWIVTRHFYDGDSDFYDHNSNFATFKRLDHTMIEVDDV